ncbi:uncharacterized protein LOC121375769 isoform X1 [Gigantopelta aegis]|uniref:uncharacterized protein LOC121375769 isoform X1 n=1 Tax=Gigantopelta aegis TaxID=1735272 RepID=UPI001B889FEC|nr:uncharacterized protein LOC121375769 isoform X1 [Gigantopelta aegis]
MDSDKTEVFKIKLLNRLYGSAHDSGSGSSGAECPEGIASSTRVKPIPVGERTRRLYTAPLPEVWPPLRAPAECPDDPQVDEGLTRSSCSSSEASDDDDCNFQKRKRRQRHKRSRNYSPVSQGSENRADVKRNAPTDLTKNQKRKLKKKRRKEKIKQNESTCSKNTEFVYVGPSKETNRSVVDAL